jgi:hypothetical protein
MQTRSKTRNQSQALHTPFRTSVKIEEIDRPSKQIRKRILPDFKNTCEDSDNDSTSTFGEDDEDLSTRKFKYARVAPINLSGLLTLLPASEPAQNVVASLGQKQRLGVASKYDVDIDFDESSRAWRANKLLVGEGHFVYKCDSCDRRRVKGSDFCGVHRRSQKNNKKH